MTSDSQTTAGRDSGSVGEPAAWGTPDALGRSAGLFGMYLLVVALGMLFAASVVAYWVIRSQHQPWPPPGFPALPRTLWLSTFAIVFSSVTIQRAVIALRQGALSTAQWQLSVALFLGLAFLGLQLAAWVQIVDQLGGIQGGQYLKWFYVLTGLHAVHVVGGLGPLAVVTFRTHTATDALRRLPAVRYCAVYWHFLDAVWCVLFTVVYLL
jgi:cytochrome c oxidase subunit III